MIPPHISVVRPPYGGVLEDDTVHLRAVNMALQVADLPPLLPARDLTTGELVDVELTVLRSGFEPFTFHGADGPEEAANSTVTFEMRLVSVRPGHRYQLWIGEDPDVGRARFEHRVVAAGELDPSELSWWQRVGRRWRR